MVLCCLVGLSVWCDFVCFTCVWSVVVWYFGSRVVCVLCCLVFLDLLRCLFDLGDVVFGDLGFCLCLCVVCLRLFMCFAINSVDLTCSFVLVLVLLYLVYVVAFRFSCWWACELLCGIVVLRVLGSGVSA